jgi:hypothetical protein
LRESLIPLLAALADLWRGLFGFHRGREAAGSHAARLEEHYRKPRRCC